MFSRQRLARPRSHFALGVRLVLYLHQRPMKIIVRHASVVAYPYCATGQLFAGVDA